MSARWPAARTQEHSTRHTPAARGGAIPACTAPWPRSARTRGGPAGGGAAVLATAQERAAPGASFGQSIVEGWTFSWRHEAVRTELLSTMGASLCIMPFTTLLPVFARDLLGVGATGQGGLLTAMGLGAVGSAVLVASLGDRLPRGLLMLGGVTLYGLSVVAFADEVLQ